MEGKDIINSVVTVMTIIIVIVVSALITGTFLSSSVFSSLTIINTTELSNGFGLFVTGSVVFLGTIGTIVGLVWLVGYVKGLFDKKSGLQSLAA
jgi:hypothetical protein